MNSRIVLLSTWRLWDRFEIRAAHSRKKVRLYYSYEEEDTLFYSILFLVLQDPSGVKVVALLPPRALIGVVAGV